MPLQHILADTPARSLFAATAAVRCCHIDAPERHRCGASICSESGGTKSKTGIDGNRATYEQAAYECHAHGLRLCEAHEVSDCCGSGCSHDGALVWTHTPCTPMVHPSDVMEKWLAEELAPVTSISSAALAAASRSAEATVLAVETASSSAASAASSAAASVSGAVSSAVAPLVRFDAAAFFDAHHTTAVYLAVGALIAAALALVVRACCGGGRANAAGRGGGGLRAYGRLKETGDSPNSSSSAAGAPSFAKTPIHGHLQIKPPLPHALRVGAVGRALPSGIQAMRPGIFANRRDDGTETGLHAGKLTRVFTPVPSPAPHHLHPSSTP